MIKFERVLWLHCSIYPSGHAFEITANEAQTKIISMLNNKQYQNFPFYATNWKQVHSLLFNHEKVIMRKEHSLQARNRNPFIIMFHSATTDLEDKKKGKEQ